MNMRANIIVKAAQDRIAPVDLANLGAKPRKDLGKLTGNVAAARNDDTLRALLQQEDFVGRDRQLVALDAEPGRGSANRNQNIPGRNRASAGNQTDRMGIFQLGPVLKDLDAGIGQVFPVNPR